jgi:hypothetical protein
MNPKTFFVRLCRPFGFMTEESYLFYLHVGSAVEAFSWVERVFEGIDTRQTPAPLRPRVGNSDPVSVVDCDLYRKHARVGGHLRAVDTPHGHFRRSEQEVVADLHKVFQNLRSERVRLAKSFAWIKTCYARDGLAWQFERLELLKQMHDKARQWEDNVWREYLTIAPGEELVLPEKRALAA